MRNTSLHFLTGRKLPRGRFRTGVSLHSHTMHSLEHLPLLQRYRSHYRVMPALLRIAGRHHRRATGQPFDLDRAFWTPPLEPHQAMAVEAAQIIGLGLPAMISLTDHDTVEAVLSMAGCVSLHRTPVSVEWTVPFANTFFHLGVHNLPAARAASIAAGLLAYTRRPHLFDLRELLESLHQDRGILILLNHPMWDEGGIGGSSHAAALRDLLRGHSRWIHALELNGLRSPDENSAVLDLAAAVSLPAISGGDRHGAEPSACINLTGAETFADFVAEVRDGGRSDVVFLPQYRDPLRLRWLEAARDILRFYPEARPGRRRWTGRFFYRNDDGTMRPLSTVWGDARTTPLETVLSLVRLIGRPALRPALKLAMAE